MEQKIQTKWHDSFLVSCARVFLLTVVCVKISAIVIFLSTPLQSATPDLTATGVIAEIDRSETYNLGATGMRGWFYVSRGGTDYGTNGTMTGESRQILVTVASAPASSVIQVNDVILGAMAGSTGTVPYFSSDSRKALGVAIGDAEKTGAGTLRVKRWRAGVTTDVNIPMAIMGNYSVTAPYSCPKSSLILANACNKLVADVLANPNFFQNHSYSNPVDGLALLAGVQPAHPNYAAIQTRLQTYARSLATEGPRRDGLDIWTWGYVGIFLSEYYFSTGDAQVLPGIHQFALRLSQSQSMFGTFGHNPALPRPDGTGRRSVIGYGPVNMAGLPANLAIVMLKKALVAGGQTVDPEITAAIQRGSDFFAWYVNKGTMPYGEHLPGADSHASNGKDQIAAMLFAQQDYRLVETEYFTRMSIAGYPGREYGHTGQGFSYLWEGMAANIGGITAVSEYLKKVHWHHDLSRRTDGSFTYEGQEQYGGGSTGDGTYLGSSSYEGLSPTSSYILTYSLPLKRLYLTGKATPATPNSFLALDSTKVANAIAAGTYYFDRTARTVTQLIGDLSEFDPVVRNFAAQELATRTLSSTQLTTLRTMLSGTNANGRMGACQTLGLLKDATAMPMLTQRLNKTVELDPWVRAAAATALGQYGNAASTQRDSMLSAFTANASDPDVITWSDPMQGSNSYLSFALFSDALSDDTINAAKNLLYPAVGVSLKQPDSFPRSSASSFAYNKLTFADVQAMPMDLINLIRYESQCDRMWAPECRGKGIRTLAKYHFAETMPLAVELLDVPTNWGFGSEDYVVPALQSLAAFGDAARWTLPTLRNYLGLWDPRSNQYAALVAAIATIEASTTSPVDITYLKAVANPQIVANTGATAITLTGSSCRAAPLTFTVLTQPSHGTLSGIAPNLTYTPSAGYTGPDSFKFQTSDSLTTSSPATVGIIVGNAGTGLKGEYFDNANFSNLLLTRTDAQVNFDWGIGSPGGLVGADTFSVRWSGQLLVPETGDYTFSTLSNEGTRLYIDGVPVIDNFVNQGTKWVDGTPITLSAGQIVTIQMEYFENTGSSVAKLKWTGPSIAGQGGAIIPQAYLYNNTSSTPYAHAQNLSTLRNTAQAITLNGSGGNLTYAVLTQPAHGSLTGSAPYLTYTPVSNYSGTDSFTFLVNNGISNSAPATVTLSIAAGSLTAFTWKNSADGTLGNAANWTSDTAPAAAGLNYYNLNFAPTGTYSVTHDLNNGFQLNQLNLSSNATFNGSNAFTFVANGGSLPQINQNNASGVSINHPIDLATNTTFGGSGSGTLALNGLISGSGGLIKNSPGVLQINHFNNTYTGGTVINNGTITFEVGDGSSAPLLGTGPVTVNTTGTLYVNRSVLSNAIVFNGGKIRGDNGWPSTLSGSITLNGITTIDLTPTGGLDISGNISGSGGLTTVGPTNWSLSGTNTYTGPTTIQDGSIFYNVAAAVGPGALVISSGGKATLNYSGNRNVTSLSLGGVAMAVGSYGSTSSPATNKNNSYFAGTGTVTVLPATTTALMLTNGSTPANIGTALTFTSTVTGSSPTGNVSFYAGTTLLGTSVLNGSFQASFTTNSLAVGNYNIIAAYAGDNSNATSASAPLDIVISGNLPSKPANVLATPNNNQIRLTWTVLPGATGYRVKRSLSNGGPFTTIGNPTTASYTDLDAVNGTTYCYVVCGFNSYGDGVNSNPVSAIPALQPSTTTLFSSASSGEYGAEISFTAVVGVSGGVATGTVTFKDGATVLGTGTLSAGSCTFTTSTLAVANHSITAEYSGDSNYPGSLSSPWSYLVTAKVSTTSTVINLGTRTGGGGTYFNAGTLYPKIAKGSLPAGSILRGVAWNVTLTQGNPYLGNLAVYFADSDGTNPVLQVGATGPYVDAPAPYTAPLQLPWNAGGAYHIGATASTSLTTSDGVPAFDLNTKAVFLETGYPGGWGGTITLTHDLLVPVPFTPTNLVAVAGNNQAGLTWNASANASGYHVKRSISNIGPYTVMSSAVTPTYTDSTLINGTTYYYVVSAYSESGESTNSNPISVTVGTPFDAWSNSNFSNGPLTNKDMAFDFDNDGLPSGIEWVLGGDPTLASDGVSKAPVFDHTTDLNYFIYRYRRSDIANADPKTTIAVVYSSNLVDWTTAVDDGISPNIMIADSNDFYGAGVDMVEVKIKRALAVSGKIFSRFKVVIAP